MTTRRPNILWLFSDQHRGDVMGVKGHPVVRTPNMDELASQGYLFHDVFCQGPLCVPARVSLMTERYVRDHGAFENDYFASAELPTMLQAIRDSGYHTTAIGKMHLFPHFPDVDDGLPLMRAMGFQEVHETVGKLACGFIRNPYTDYLDELGLLDTYRSFVRARTPWRRDREARADSKPTWAVDPSPLPAEHYLDTWVGRRAVEWLESYRSEDPFFLWVGFPGPHDPWDAPIDYVRRYEGADVPLDSTRRPDIPEEGPLSVFLRSFLRYSSSDTLTDERARDVRRHYFANVTLIDEAIGRILAALERAGLADDTWVVYSSDHGEMLGTHGFLNKMVFYEPSVRVPLIVRPPGGAPNGEIRSGLLEHVDLSATLRSLAGAGEVPGSAGRSFASTFSGSLLESREVVVSENYGFAMWRTDRYKLVVYEKGVLPVQLFDLVEDPSEDHNRVADPAYAAIVDDMLDAFARPFLSTPPLRPGPDIVERSGEFHLNTTRGPASPGD